MVNSRLLSAGKLASFDAPLDASAPAFDHPPARPGACEQRGAIAKAFLVAETEWRKALASVTVADIIRTAASESFNKSPRRIFPGLTEGCREIGGGAAG